MHSVLCSLCIILGYGIEVIIVLIYSVAVCFVLRSHMADNSTSASSFKCTVHPLRGNIANAKVANCQFFFLVYFLLLLVGHVP